MIICESIMHSVFLDPKMKIIGSLLLAVTLCSLGCDRQGVSNTSGVSGDSLSLTEDTQQTAGEVASYQEFINLTSRDVNLNSASLQKIDQGWHSGSTVMLLEASGFSKSRTASLGISMMLKSKTRQQFRGDTDWFDWIWNQEYDPHPEYAQFKSELYSSVDPRFAEYFSETDNAQIRLDEIRWGGVMRDGIPPLKDPEMIAVTGADYLVDSDVVFGVELNGDARCYPKRILAWHEMFKDTIGGESVCGVY